MPITRVTTDSEVGELARGLFDTGRDRPWCVVSVPVGRTAPYFQANEFVEHAGDVCPVFVIKTGSLSMALEGLLPHRCQVLGGAAMVALGDGTFATISQERTFAEIPASQ